MTVTKVNDSALRLFLSLENNLSQGNQQPIKLCSDRIQMDDKDSLTFENRLSFKEHKTLADIFVTPDDLKSQATVLSSLTGDAYQKQVINPAESNERYSVIKLVNDIANRIIQEEKDGPLYLAEIELKIELKTEPSTIRVGVLAQNRHVNNGVWTPALHEKAGLWLREIASRQLPLVTFIDTPGADAGSAANMANQAHSISALISLMADLKVPTIGIVWGLGYSGGAIPLAATNILLSVKDGIFSTIQPQGLASIARKQKLDWQTCAKLVGVSAPELFDEGILDGVINYSPLQGHQNNGLVKDAIFASLALIEDSSRKLVSELKPLHTYYCDKTLSLSGEENQITREKQLTSFEVGAYPSIFGFAHSALRSLQLRSRLTTQSVQLDDAGSDNYEHLISPDEQLQALSDKRFEAWYFEALNNGSDRIIYEDSLLKAWTRYREKEVHQSDDRAYVVSLFLGDPKENFDSAQDALLAEIAFYLYNNWQQESQHHLSALSHKLRNIDGGKDCNAIAKERLTVLDLIQDTRFKSSVLEHCGMLAKFDALYEQILANLSKIVSALSEHKKVSEHLLKEMLTQANIDNENDFGSWLIGVRHSANFGQFLRTAELWKKSQHPRLSDVVFVVASYFFEKLYPEMFECQSQNKVFTGQFVPVSIGRRKDFWNRLHQAIKDIRIQAVLNDIKPANNFTYKELIDANFENFTELDGHITTVNPKRFPGFGESILRQQSQSKLSNSTSGLITGTASFKFSDETIELDSQFEKQFDTQFKNVGLFVSNHAFQAGAFDMASAERLCRLLAYCGEHSLPVIGFVSSGGMQTKEGAAALFSMAVVNDQITRFVSDLGLPILMFGYGDCTGGAQASLVTHPLVDTYYFSGTNMPFAGRIVVPEYLPVTATLANYLVSEPNSMKSIVEHPIISDVDSRLREIDSGIASADLTVNELINSWLSDKELADRKTSINHTISDQKFEPYKKVLIHARGCTAVKLIREAHAIDLSVVLVQSDPDMDSVAADMLKADDNLVCLGGYTSDESYLNGDSVLRIAEIQGAQALHPGIGFLSENRDFAQQCLAQGLNFIGPSPESMKAMGDKSRAIHTAISLGVPVVPGSHGLLKNVEHAEQVASEIGYPIILKAAHGGGGKGIVVVETAESLEEKFYMIKAEARSSFGSDEIYLERLVTRFRHIEVQLLRDRFESTLIIGLRDCSVQRNKQKIIEESASTILPEYQEKIATDSAYKLAEACDYHGAGTVEFIYDLDRDTLYFMEMNTRLQVEHPVTEKVSGIDIVKEQYRIAMGQTIEGLIIEHKGYAIEVRINAETVEVERGALKVVPSPGVVSKCLFPETEDITHIIAVDEGKSVPPFYDNLIAQVIVHADTRNEAIAKMIDHLSSVVLEGIDTNIALLQVILNDQLFVSGDYDTSYLDKLIERNPDAALGLKNDTEISQHASEHSASIVVEGSDELKVLAPSTSIVYRSSSPDQPAYIQEGDTISVDQTLCLLEAMKMFQPLSLSHFNKHENEVYPSDQQYQVTHIKSVADQQVNRGDLLFVIKPVTTQVSGA